MPSRKNRNSAAHINASASNVASKLVAAPKTAPVSSDSDQPALDRIDQTMASAIVKVSTAIIAEMVVEAGLETGTPFEQWKALKDVKYIAMKLRIAQMYETAKFGKLNLRGLEKRAAKEALWSELKLNKVVQLIESDHAQFVERSKKGYEKRTQWGIEHQNNKKGRVIKSEEVASYEEVQAYMAQQRRANA